MDYGDVRIFNGNSCNFGKHKGATLKEIYKTDRDYISWLADGEKTDAKIKEAIALIKAGIAKGKENKK